jgi:selenocysteine lyase/cysteine desulfurase
MANTDLDMESVRARFPALGKQQVFFDNAGGSQILGTAIEAYVIVYLQKRCQFAVF